MKLIYWVLALLLIIAICLVLIVVGAEPAETTGSVHEQFPAMRIGGDGASRYLPVGMLVLILQSAAIVLFGVLLYLGVNERRRSRLCRVWIVAGSAASMLIWWAIAASYTEFLETGTTEMVLGFPVATALTVFGLWLSGFALVLGYVFGFRSFIFTFDDEVRFNELVEQVRREQEQH
jgi:4-amino-4-deoxy-L-arabinose transferase-like glycosyltransferase